MRHLLLLLFLLVTLSCQFSNNRNSPSATEDKPVVNPPVQEGLAPEPAPAPPKNLKTYVSQEDINTLAKLCNADRTAIIHQLSFQMTNYNDYEWAVDVIYCKVNGQTYISNDAESNKDEKHYIIELPLYLVIVHAEGFNI